MKVSSIAATARLGKGQSSAGLARRPALQGLLRLASGDHALGWADQAVVSAASFLAMIMVGRWTDPSALGAYAIGGSVLALLLATQESLITRPYAIQLHRPLGTPEEHAFSSLVLSLLLSVAGVVVLGAAAVALSFSAYRDAAAISAALAGAVPFVLTREFARRFAFAHLKTYQALMLDLPVAALNVALLAWLGWTGQLSAATAFAAVGIACGIGAAGWLYLARRAFAFRLGKVQATLKQSWGLGKWLFSSHLALQAQGYMTYWLSLVIGGVAVTGIYTACMSIVSFANPLLFGFFNVLTPKFVRALRYGGGAGLRRQAAWDALLLGTLMSGFCVLVLWFGDQALSFLYPGPDYRGQGDILGVLALAAVAAAIGGPAAIALTTAEHARAAAAVTAVTAVLNLGLVWGLMTHWGLLGAAYGMLIAEVVCSLGRWATFLMLVPATRRPDPDLHGPTEAEAAALTQPSSSGGTLS